MKYYKIIMPSYYSYCAFNACKKSWNNNFSLEEAGDPLP